MVRTCISSLGSNNGVTTNRCNGQRTRNLSQSSCNSIAERNETDILILQQSPVLPSCWTVASYESQSDVSSACGDTPPTSRSRRGSKIGSYNDDCNRKLSVTSLPNSRPSSLSMSMSADVDSQLNKSSNSIGPLSSDQVMKQPSSAASILSNLTFVPGAGISGAGCAMKDNSSSSGGLACSVNVDALTRIRGYQETGNGSSDDESTPLVSEMSSPMASGPQRNSGESNWRFGNMESPGSCETSLGSVKSSPTQDAISSSESISKVLEGVEGFYNFALVESPKGREAFPSALFHGQDMSLDCVEEEEDTDAAKFDWNDPETTV